MEGNEVVDLTAGGFDLQPEPRILPMLGEISLPQWRCVAELIDNSVDGFIAALREGKRVENPQVHVALPMTDATSAKITVADNGPGMDPATLEKAVRAGWTGSDPMFSLGMYGMGFNIATARLGTLTRVWTTREDDPEWHGLEIDFDKLIRQRHYRTPHQHRAKRDPKEHGTEISIERLKPEQREWFTKKKNDKELRQSLGRAYSPMLSSNGVPIQFTLTVNRYAVVSKRHCIWSGDGANVREVMHARHGNIPVYIPINQQLGDRLFCNRCLQWLPYVETTCPTCESADRVVTRRRRIYGWLGIQRYLHSTSYGIDFVRHGRKIELENKELFFWMHEDGTSEQEYPIDDPRFRGRIVGEIHLDHCRVAYTKDRFDRNDPAWDEMVTAVKGDGPLRPEKASELGYGINTSPLFLLFQAFRRSSPQNRAMAGAWGKILIVPDNSRAEEMAARFQAGELEHQTDAKWWELVEEADRALLTPAGGGKTATPTPGIEGFGDEPSDAPSPSGVGSSAPQVGEPEGSTLQTPAPPARPAPPPQRTGLASLTREYRDRRTGVQWNVAAYQVEPSDPGLGSPDRPWRLTRLTTGVHEFFVNTAHHVFRSATMTPLDALLAELAWSAMDFQRGSRNPSEVTFADVLADLREAYGASTRLDTASLSTDAAQTLSAIARSLAGSLSAEDSQALFAELTPADQDAVWRSMATRAVRDPQGAVSMGRFLEFAQARAVLRFFERHPELFFDGKYWDDAYATLDYGRPAATEEAQTGLVRYYGSLLTDVIWLAEQDPADLATASKARLVRAAQALELLAPSGERQNAQ